MGESEAAVREYIDSVAGVTRRRDAQTLLEMMTRITGEVPQMWNASIVGFGEYHYKYASGREGDAPAASFSPRKPSMTIYLPDGIGAHADALEQLGNHTTGVGCLYIKDFDTVDLSVLEEIIAASYGSVVSGSYVQRARESSEK